MFHISSENVSNSTVNLRTYYSAEGFRDFSRLLNQLLKRTFKQLTTALLQIRAYSSVFIIALSYFILNKI